MTNGGHKKVASPEKPAAKKRASATKPNLPRPVSKPKAGN